MATFLPNGPAVRDRIDALIANAGEYVYLVSPYLYHLPFSIVKLGAEALQRNVRVVIIFKKGLFAHGKEVDKLLQLPNVTLLAHEHVHARFYMSEKTAVISSLNVLAGEETYTIDNGVELQRDSEPEFFESLVKEAVAIEKASVAMRVEDSRLVEIPVVKERPVVPVEQRKPIEEALGNMDATRKLTPKEKQDLLLRIFEKECPDCVLKVEDKERFRLPGVGIVIFTNKEWVEIIFVRYDYFKSIMDEMQTFVGKQDPSMKAWFTYNRIRIAAEKPAELYQYFGVFKHAFKVFELV